VPVELTVEELRRQLSAERDAADAWSAARVAMSDLFHETITLFFSPNSSIHLIDVLEDVEPDVVAWKAALVDAAYAGIVAARLQRDQATLTQCPDEVFFCWQAIENLCDWLATVLLGVYRKHGRLDAARDLIDCERLLQVELREPGWADSVRLRGPVDAVMRVPDTQSWCVVVLKTGAVSREANLMQAAMYNLLLSKDEVTRADMRVVFFAPDRGEQPITDADLTAAEAQLRARIGRIAGVDTVPGESRRPASVAIDWKTVTDEHRRMQADLLRVLQAYGLAATVDAAPQLGPTFIRFLVTPASGAKVSRFTGLAEELALGMKLKNPPLIERLGGRIAVDIERPDRFAVQFEELRALLPTPDPLLGNSRVLIGVDVDGSPVFVDLARPEHCHMLVVGTAGSGKSIWMRAAIASLIETNTPQTLQLVLIDPKRTGFAAWRNSPFLREPIVFPNELSPARVLAGLIDEMESRYARMAELHVDDLAGLARKENRSCPRIVCACDEYADLVVTSDDRREIEDRIARLGAKARAAGIHLILATQTPRREIIGGAIKANLPTCVSLRVSSGSEARIIEMPGAELLLGAGDLLLRSVGEPRRLQAALLPGGGDMLSQASPTAGAAAAKDGHRHGALAHVRRPTPSG
jgi:S-DNA-T family DNA segregation ATPase FtsK/SpoIIIE